MNRWLGILGATLLSTALGGCSNEAATSSRDANGTVVVQGTVSQQLVTNDARAVAIGTNGRTFWAYLDKKRDFRLTLPVGQSYQIMIANQRTSGGQTVVGRLVLTSPAGKTSWLGANVAGATVDLGTLSPSQATSGLSVKSYDQASESEGSDEHENHDDDNACHENKKDGQDEGEKGGGDAEGKDDDADVCSSGAAGDEKELAPSNAPGKECEDDDHHTEPAKVKACAGGDDDGKAGGSAGDDDGKGGDAEDGGAAPTPAPSK